MYLCSKTTSVLCVSVASMSLGDFFGGGGGGKVPRFLSDDLALLDEGKVVDWALPFSWACLSIALPAPSANRPLLVQGGCQWAAAQGYNGQWLRGRAPVTRRAT